MTEEKSIVQTYDQVYQQNYYAWNDFYPFAERDLKFYLGDQWDDSEKKALSQEGRSTFVYNLIRPNINMVAGYQKKHRHSSIVVPIENQDQQTADQLTQLLLYVFQHQNGYETISDCFRGGLITGWNLLSIWKDYRNDPVNGDICFGREPYNGFICDPYFSKKDMSDCSNIIRRRYLSLQQTQSMLPGNDKELENLYNLGWERDDKFTWLPYQQQPNGAPMMAYDEFWEQGWEKKKFIYNVVTGEESEYLGEESDFFLYVDPNVELIEKEVQYVDQHIIVNNVYMGTERNPYGLNEYPFVPFFAIFEPESSDYVQKIQSLVRVMVDPQREANRRRSQMVDIVESQINSGWLAEDDSVINPQSLYKTSQGQVVWKKKGLMPGALERLQPAQVPPSFFQLTELHDQDIMKVSNISEELLGQADSEQDSGLKVMLRQGAALVGLQDLFDNLRFAQKTVSKKALKLIQTWSPQKMQRILGEMPTEAIFNKQTLKYDVAVQEGVLTDTQQQMFFRQLIALKELGEPIPPGLMVRAAPLQGKTEYLKAMEEFTKQQQQAAQEQKNLQDQLMASDSETRKAKAISDIALSKERFTRAIANMGLQEERNAEAIQNRSQAALDRAKTIKELESMDDSRLLKYFQIVKMMEEENKIEEEEHKREDIAVTEVSEQLNAAFPKGENPPPPVQ